eukprot:880311-Pleurochrysis_carterae.AAC.1
MKVAKDKDANDLELGGAPPLSWSAMWDLFDKRAPSAHAAGNGEQQATAAATAPAAAASSSSASAEPLA